MIRGTSLLLAIEVGPGGHGVPPDVTATPFAHVYGLPPLHTRLERLGVRPTYLVSAEVAADPRSAEVLRFLQVRGTCEIGVRSATAAARGARPHDGDRFEAELRALTAAVAHATGDRPVTHRAPSGSFVPAFVVPLERAGYLVDASVAAHAPAAHVAREAPRRAPARPYFLAYDSTARAGSSLVLEVPATADVDGAAAGLLHGLRWSSSAGMLRRIGLARRAPVRPAAAPPAETHGVARRLVARGAAAMAAVIGCGELTGNEQGLERLEAFVRYAMGELGVSPLTYREFRAAFVAP